MNMTVEQLMRLAEQAILTQPVTLHRNSTARKVAQVLSGLGHLGALPVEIPVPPQKLAEPSEDFGTPSKPPSGDEGEEKLADSTESEDESGDPTVYRRRKSK